MKSNVQVRVIALSLLGLGAMVVFQNFIPSSTGNCGKVADAACAEVIDLLSRREGFGVETTGGLGGSFIEVTSDADSGPGSLREALESRNPAWIRFRVVDKISQALQLNVDIRLKSPIRISSHKTLDGRGAHVRIIDQGFRVLSSENIIIHNIQLGMLYSDENKARIDLAHGTSEKYLGDDGITIAGDATKKIWIDHCLIEHFSDGLVDISSSLPESKL